jgi:hypothetical protein
LAQKLSSLRPPTSISDDWGEVMDSLALVQALRLDLQKQLANAAF